MHVSIRKFLMLTLGYFAGSVWSFAYANNQQANDTSTRVSSALNELTIKDANTRARARDQLLVLPPELVIPSIIDVLRSDSRFEDRSTRREAYGILVKLHAETTRSGRQVLFAGLVESDAYTPVLCADALTKANEEIRTQAVDLLSERWDDSIARFGYPSRPIVQAIGLLGGSAQRFLERLQPVFANAELDKDLRMDAAHAMVRIGGIEYVLEYLGNHDLDPADEWLLVAAVASGVHEANETDEMPPAMRQKILHLVLKHMRNEHKDIREQALQVLFFLLWDKVDVFIIRAPNAYELNPIVKEAVDNMAANDPDEVLRRTAAGTLEQLDLNKVERILRSRQQEQQTKPQGNE